MTFPLRWNAFSSSCGLRGIGTLTVRPREMNAVVVSAFPLMIQIGDQDALDVLAWGRSYRESGTRAGVVEDRPRSPSRCSPLMFQLGDEE